MKRQRWAWGVLPHRGASHTVCCALLQGISCSGVTYPEGPWIPGRPDSARSRVLCTGSPAHSCRWPPGSSLSWGDSGIWGTDLYTGILYSKIAGSKTILTEVWRSGSRLVCMVPWLMGSFLALGKAANYRESGHSCGGPQTHFTCGNPRKSEIKVKFSQKITPVRFGIHPLWKLLDIADRGWSGLGWVCF